MSMSEWVNYGASIATLLGGLAFVITYHATARWYTSSVGRMMMAYGGAITGLAALSVVYYALHVDVTWIRYTRAVLLFLVGVVMWYQAFIVVKVQRRNRKKT